MRALRVTNWDRWQSYRIDRGQPPWIKVHRTLLRNPEWTTLSDAQRGQLVQIWILAADKNGVIESPNGVELPTFIRRVCCMESEPDLQLFESLRFVSTRMSTSKASPRRQRDANVTPTRRQDDASLTPQSREEKSREEKSREETDICAAPSEKVAALIPACSNQQFAVTESKQAEYQESYPGIDVALELRAVRQWCLDNPTRQKTQRGVPRFVNAWLSKAQNSGRRSKKPTQTAQEHLAEIDAEEAAERQAP